MKFKLNTTLFWGRRSHLNTAEDLTEEKSWARDNITSKQSCTLSNSIPATSILVAAAHSFLTDREHTHIERVLLKSMFFFSADSHKI